MKGQPKLTVTSPEDNNGDGVGGDEYIQGSKDTPGQINEVISTHTEGVASGHSNTGAFEAKVMDGTSREDSVPGIVVKFHANRGGVYCRGLVGV